MTNAMKEPLLQAHLFVQVCGPWTVATLMVPLHNMRTSPGPHLSLDAGVLTQVSIFRLSGRGDPLGDITRRTSRSLCDAVRRVHRVRRVRRSRGCQYSCSHHLRLVYGGGATRRRRWLRTT